MLNSSKEKSGKYFWIIFAVITVIYVAAMSVFTFYDYEITSSLYDKGTAFGVIFEISGPVFMPFFGIYSIVSLPFVLKVKKTPVKVLLYVVLILLYAYYCFMGAFTLKYSYAPFMFIPSIIIYVTFTVLCFFINVKMPDSKRAIHKCVILVTFFTVLTAMLGVDLIKVVFGRKRFYTITSEEYAPWYVIQSHALNSSFPSGHVSRAALSLCFALLCYYKNKKYVPLIKVVAVIFTVLVAVSRLYEGMHYPTDVITAVFITMSVFFISERYLIRTKKL